MPPTPSDHESQILTTFLLARSSLTDIVPLSTFTTLFPREHRQNPQIRLLYRELQLDRARTCRRVANNIRVEVELGVEQRRGLGRGGEGGGIDVFGGGGRRAGVGEVLRGMEEAVAELEEEMERAERECEEVLEYVAGVVDELSDLRYGKMGNAGTVGQVVHQLENLTRVCERRLMPEGSGDGGDGQ